MTPEAVAAAIPEVRGMLFDILLVTNKMVRSMEAHAGDGPADEFAKTAEVHQKLHDAANILKDM